MKNTIVRKDMNMDMFIIPNQAGKVNNFWTGVERQTSIADMLCNLNGFDFDPKHDKVVQVWSCCDDCNNMQDHFFHETDDEGNEYRFRFPSSYIPAKILKDHVEGETFDIVYRMKPENWDNKEWDKEDESEELPEFEFIFHTTLAQKKYRYRSFGNFEDVLFRVCR
ncbi:MAG: hypothetical protein IKR19_07920 [Acholeplasmatales bacterium]|nr:hypothetical protein [Acholeplasmatales bacterium]